MSFSHHMWILPFISLVAGYSFISFLYPIKKIAAPSLIGMRLEDSVKLLSQNNLNLRIIGTKQDAELPAATIVNQTPCSNTPLKEYQTIYCVISYQPQPPIMPALVNSSDAQAAEHLQNLHIRAKFHYVPHSKQKGSCIAQSVTAEQPITAQETAHIYVSLGSSKPVIMPQLKNSPLPAVIEALNEQGYSYTILGDPHENARSCQHCIVIDQWPRSGSFILNNELKQPTIQLQIKHKDV